MNEDSKSNWKSRLLIGLLIFLLIGTLFFLTLLSSSFVAGEEFSPDDFSRRRFHYFQLPLVKWVIRGIDYEDCTSDMERSLSTEGWISSTPPTIWHLSRDGSGLLQPAESDARFLVDLLNLKSQQPEYVFFWQEWNEKYPALAGVLWPLVANLARDEMYLAIPELMLMAVDIRADGAAPSLETFEGQLRLYLAEVYQRFADIDRAAGRTARADARAQRAAEYLSQ
jgi:hypothetical protein